MKRVDTTYAPRAWKPRPLVKLGQGGYDREYTAMDFAGHWLRSTVIWGTAALLVIGGCAMLGLLLARIISSGAHERMATEEQQLGRSQTLVLAALTGRV